MNRKIFLLFLVCLVVALVKSESTIEVDENGDEYDVKRFNVQGRQLNGGRSQCVVTRRKRAAPPTPMYFDDESNDEVDENDKGDTIKLKEQEDLLHYSPTFPPTSGESNMNEGNINKKEDEETLNNAEESDNNNSEDYKEIEEENEDYNEEDNNETIEVIRFPQVPSESNNSNSEDNKEIEEENEDNNEEYNNEIIEIIRFPHVPVSGQLEESVGGESVAAIGLTSGIGQVESHHANAGSNGIVVVQSHTPPKVNPQTHAVFELVPVSHAGSHEDEENEDDNNEDDFDFKEELSPITTTAIWSTGADESNENSTEKPVKPQKTVQKNRKPVKAHKKTKKTALKPKRKNKNKGSFQDLPGSSFMNRPNKSNKNKNNNKNKRRPYVRRPNKRRKLRPDHNIRPRPSSQKNRNSNRNKNRLVAKRRRGNGEYIGQGGNFFNRNEDVDKNVNCIIIRHEPPSTTARPFWNILGRSANGAPQASGHFGKRKRVNVRFVA